MEDAVEADRRSILLAGAAQINVLRRLLRADAAPLLSLLVGGDRMPPLEGGSRICRTYVSKDNILCTWVF